MARASLLRRYLCLGLLVSMDGGAAALSPTELFTHAAPGVLLLEGRDADAAIRTVASAIALGEGVAVTQCNVLSGATSWRVTQAARTYAAYPHGRDEARNLCRLDVPGLRAAAPQFVPREQIRVGQRVYAIGNALGLGLSLSEGLVSGVRTLGGEDWIQTTAPLASGSEGGALFDDNGRLLGMTDYGRRDGQNINFAAPAVWLGEVMSRAGRVAGYAAGLARARALYDAADWSGLRALAGEYVARAADDAETWLWLGIAHEGLNAHAESATAFARALAIAPDSLAALLGLARNQLRQQQLEAAAATLAPALTAHRVEADVWFLQGVLENARGNNAAAEAALRETVQFNPRHIDAWRQRYTLALARGDYRSAQEFAGHLTRLQPGSVDAWLQLADAQLKLQRWTRALQTLDRALAIEPNSPWAQLLTGHALAAQRRNVDAIAAYRRALAGKLPQPELAWAGLSQVYYTLQQFPAAIAAQREAVRLVPQSLPYQADLGVALKDGGHDEDALGVFIALRDKAPEDPFAWRQIGFVNAKLGRLEPAIAALEQSLKLAHDQPKVWHVLAEQHALSGHEDEVRRIYQRLRGMDAAQAEQLYRNRLQPLEPLPANAGSTP